MLDSSCDKRIPYYVGAVRLRLTRKVSRIAEDGAFCPFELIIPLGRPFRLLRIIVLNTAISYLSRTVAKMPVLIMIENLETGIGISAFEVERRTRK